MAMFLFDLFSLILVVDRLMRFVAVNNLPENNGVWFIRRRNEETKEVRWERSLLGNDRRRLILNSSPHS